MQLKIMLPIESAVETPNKMKPRQARAKKIELITITALRESQQPRIRCPCFVLLLSLLPGMRGVESTMVTTGARIVMWRASEVVIICSCVVAENVWLLFMRCE